MTDPDENLAPGCFGLAAAYSEKSPTCALCRWNKPCSLRAAAMMATLRSKMGVAATAKVSVKSVKESPGESLPIAGDAVREVLATATAKTETRAPSASNALSKNSQKLVARLGRVGVPLLATLEGGANPFDAGPEFLRVACNMIMAGPFTRRQFRDTFMASGKVTEGTASSHVAFTIPALVHLGVIEESNGTITRKKA